MKYFVWEKRFFALISNLIVMDILLVSVLVFFIIHVNSPEISFPFSAIVIIFNILSILMMQFDGSIISFAENEIKCIFLKHVRRIMAYSEIQDYGVFNCGTIFQGKEKFIYISRVELTEEQREVKAYKLYRKSENILVLKYHEQVLSFLRNKCPDIMPRVSDASL